MNANTIAVAVGYGRNEGLGKTAGSVGRIFIHASLCTTIDYFAAM
jgi:hypothetical protein